MGNRQRHLADLDHHRRLLEDVQVLQEIVLESLNKKSPASGAFSLGNLLEGLIDCIHDEKGDLQWYRALGASRSAKIHRFL